MSATQSPRRTRSSLLFAWLLTASSLGAAPLGAACGGDDDAPPPPPPPMPCGAITELAWVHGISGTVVGGTRLERVGIDRNYCDDLEVTFASSDPAVVAAPSPQTIPRGRSEVAVTLTALAVGESTLTATISNGAEARTSTLRFVVADASVPTCSGSASGTLRPGGEVKLAGGALAGVGVALPAGAARDDAFRVEPFDATVACAADIVPAGYRPLGPAVTVGPDDRAFRREIPVTIPVKTALLPDGAGNRHVLIAFRSARYQAPRIVAFASPALTGTPADGRLTFETPRLGTFQAVVAEGAGTPRARRFKFRAVTGFSMGAIGSSQLGMRHPELFDFSAPLGGPTDFVQTIRYFREYNFGGFCTEADRAVPGNDCDAGSSLARTPPNDELYQVPQDYEHWYYEDRYGGQGGTFDREEWLQIFRDLSFMYGNPNTNRTLDPSEPNITPPGVPDSVRMLPNATRCAMPVVIAPEPEGGDDDPTTGFFDDEYNPEGRFPVTTYCDGAEVRVGGVRDIGVWDPAGRNAYPAETFLAVDRNGNGVRDPGEPIIRNMWEPFDDVGLDGVPSALEPGYDPVTNPDPAGDDYDFQFNPGGTEGNWLRDGADDAPGAPGVAEPFRDVGLDGLPGTPQLAEGGYDSGEGNGRYDRASGTQRMFDRNPKLVALGMPEAQLRDLDVFADGGIRDLLNSLPSTNHFLGAFAARGRPVRMYNGHSALDYSGRNLDEVFDFTRIDWLDVGGSVLVRYGNVDASEQMKIDGDGGHVGTVGQLFARLQSAVAWMSARWPDGNRDSLSDSLCMPGACANPNQLTIMFESPTTGRVGPAGIILPPGYFKPENAGLTYPVIYLGHGYGMSPEDLILTAIVFWNSMRLGNVPYARRLQKMIFVFPDGLCRNGECIQGTFYTDAPPGTPGGAQMETWLLDLMEYVDATYRTRPASEHMVID
jgi:hypothetical protein